MHNQSPLASIIIPTFNRAQVLVETINSVLNQTYTNWECIIVDDGSNDNSLSIIKSRIKQDKRIVLKKRDTEDKGAPACRNIGFSYSRGLYILFLDSDDIIASNFLEEQVESLKNSKYGASISTIRRFHNNINSSKSWYSTNDNITLQGFLKNECTWRTSSVLWKREAILKIGKFHTKLKAFQDWLMYIKHFSNNDSFIVNNNTCLYYRENWSKNQISNKTELLNSAYCFSRRLAFGVLLRKIIFDSSIRRAFLHAYCIDYKTIKKKWHVFIVAFHYLILTHNVKGFFKTHFHLIKMVMK